LEFYTDLTDVGTNLTFEFKCSSNIYSLFQQYTSGTIGPSGEGAIGNYVDFVPASGPVKLVLPGAAEELLVKRVMKGIHSIRHLFLLSGEEKQLLFNSMMALKEGFLDTYPITYD